MNRHLAALFLALAVAFTLAACGEKEPPPPPDLTGNWSQPGDAEWYHIAEIEGDTITVWWYLPAEDLRELYWKGTFEAPQTGEEPYSWTSSNLMSMEELSKYIHRRTSREETKTFTYKKGKLSYIVTAGHLRMTVTMEKVEN